MTARLLTPTQIIRGGMYIVIQSVEGATLTCSAQTYTLATGETYHAFSVTAGTYTCTANKMGYYEASASVTISSGVEPVTLYPPNIPAAYQEVEYLRSDGNQYIVTNVTNAANQIINCKFRFEVDRTQRIFGTNSETQFIYVVGSSKSFIAMNNAVTYTEHVSPVIGNTAAYDVTINNNTTLNINGYDYANCVNYGGATTQSEFYIFKRPGDSGNICLVGRIYKFNVTQSGSKIIDLIPCYRKSDSVAGMFDKVTETFLTNSGSGNFTVGADVNQ